MDSRKCQTVTATPAKPGVLLFCNRNYEWPDYHDGKDGKYTGVGLKTTGIPVLLLIDASGKIAYFHPGADDEPGLLAAVRHLGPAFASAMDEAEK